MKQHLILISLLILAVTGSHAQTDTTKYWKTNLNVGLNVNQASFSSNWKAGGVNSIGLNSLFNFKANYQKNRNSWDNEIDLLFGFLSSQGQGYRKTNDRIYIDTRYGYKLNEHWNVFSSLNLLTQFSKGYNYTTNDVTGIEESAIISDFFAPAFVTSSWGLEYHHGEVFKARISPFAPRLTIVKDPERFVTVDNPTPYGVTPPDETRLELLAFQLAAEFNKDIAPNLNLKWRYVMFANYETLEAKTIDHRLDLNITAKVNKYINVGLGGILLYDYDQDHSVQLSQALTLGFLYTFRNYPEEKKE
jgi:hypothetical protein